MLSESALCAAAPGYMPDMPERKHKPALRIRVDGDPRRGKHCYYIRSAGAMREGSCECGWDLPRSREGCVRDLSQRTHGALVVSPVCTALPGFRVDYAAAFGQPLRLAQSCVFGVQDLAGPNPSQPRLGEVYPDHMNVMVLEDNCHGSGDIAHANSVLSLLIVAWNATTMTVPVHTPTATFSDTLTSSISLTGTSSMTGTPTLSITATKTTVPFCLLAMGSTICVEGEDRELLQWLLLLLPLVLCCCICLFAWCRGRPPPPRPVKKPPPELEPALGDEDEGCVVHVKQHIPEETDDGEILVTARPDDNVLVTARSPLPPLRESESDIIISVQRSGSSRPAFSSPPRSHLPESFFASPLRSLPSPTATSGFPSIHRQFHQPPPLGPRGPQPRTQARHGSQHISRGERGEPNWQDACAPLLEKGLLLV
eukprot:Hpha_TRINITY_DN16830_c2_g7::TRINITY_DN16830_c2_g7_i2::g.153665::m.153665